MLIRLIVLITFQSIHIASSSANTDVKPIKYPGPVKEITNRYGSVNFNVTVPKECRDKKFCLIRPLDYPQAQFNKMFQGYKPQEQPTLVLEDFGDRQGDPTETDGCETKVTYEPLYQVKSNVGEWRMVIQAPEENYVQKIRLEECKDTNSRCFDVFPESLGIETHCRQTVARWEVLVAGGPNGSEHIQTDLPICCSCVYKLP